MNPAKNRKQNKNKNKSGNVVVRDSHKRPKKKIAQDNSLVKIGGLAGGLMGGPVGAQLGSVAGRLLSRIMGSGAYTVSRNSLLSEGVQPQFMNLSDGIHICHREFLYDITGSTAFELSNLFINPGLATTFPWLSQVAQNFEEYEFRGLVFEYNPSSGSAISSSSSALGKVVYATSYDVTDPNFISKQQMESYQYSCAVVPFEKMLHPVECAPQTNVLQKLYVRSTNVPAGEDQRFYDIGNFQVATVGMQSPYIVGELWVTYDVILSKPRLQSAPQGYLHLQNTVASNCTAANPFSVVGMNIINSTYNGVLPTAIATIIRLPSAGTYVITATWVGGSIAASPTISLGSYIVGVNNLNMNATASNATFLTTGFGASITLSVQVTHDIVASTPSNNYITFGGLTGMVSANCDIFISAAPETSGNL